MTALMSDGFVFFIKNYSCGAISTIFGRGIVKPKNTKFILKYYLIFINFSVFIIDFDKSTRIYYEILFIDENEKMQILSRTILNILLLMNTVEKLLQNNKSFEPLLEHWRCMMRLKNDTLHVKPKSLAKTNIEITYKGKRMEFCLP
jgi:hypothetical protein